MYGAVYAVKQCLRFGGVPADTGSSAVHRYDRRRIEFAALRGQAASQLVFAQKLAGRRAQRPCTLSGIGAYALRRRRALLNFAHRTAQYLGILTQPSGLPSAERARPAASEARRAGKAAAEQQRRTLPRGFRANRSAVHRTAPHKCGISAKMQRCAVGGTRCFMWCSRRRRGAAFTKCRVVQSGYAKPRRRRCYSTAAFLPFRSDTANTTAGPVGTNAAGGMVRSRLDLFARRTGDRTGLRAATRQAAGRQTNVSAGTPPAANADGVKRLSMHPQADWQRELCAARSA